MNINEGINQITKSYKEQIIDLYLKNGYGKYTIDLKNNELPLYNTSIIFIENESEFANINSSNVKFSGNNCLNMSIYLYFPKNTTENNIVTLLIHELNHVVEFYNITKHNLKNPTNIKYPSFMPLMFGTGTNSVDKYEEFAMFKYIVYYTLDNETNSRVAQMYQTLFSFHTYDRQELLDKLHNTFEWRQLSTLKKEKSENVVKDLLKKMGLNLTLMVVKLFNTDINNMFQKLKPNNKTYKFLQNELKTEEDLYRYFSNWFLIIKHKIIKMQKKLEDIIEEVIKDNRVYMEGVAYKPKDEKSMITKFFKYIDEINESTE